MYKRQSESCEISIKTIRNRITDINKMLVYQKVGCIESRPHYGYKLRVHNNVKFKEFLENFTEAKQAVPENPQERAFGAVSYTHLDVYKRQALFLYMISQHI